MDPIDSLRDIMNMMSGIFGDGRNQIFYKLDEDGNVRTCSQREWSSFIEGPVEGRVVGKSEVGRYEVSTVFLGLDHNYSDKGDPLVFETMVFDSRKEEDPSLIARYSNMSDAKIGHATAVKATQISVYGPRVF